MIQELIAKLKEQGVSEEEIKAQLEALKQEIDELLAPKPEEEKPEEVKEETEEEKMKRVFGI